MTQPIQPPGDSPVGVLTPEDIRDLLLRQMEYLIFASRDRPAEARREIAATVRDYAEAHRLLEE